MQRNSLLLLAAALVIIPAAGAQVLTYTLLDSSSPKPSARFDGTIVYDLAGRQVFLFGGQDSAPRNDLWSYSLALRRWTELQPQGPKPPARFGHTLVFDSARRRVVVFGGQAGGFFSDVWAYDIAQGIWQQLKNDDSGPSRRYGHSAIYEVARDRMVISHGFTNAGRFDDTWALEFAGNSWRNITPSGARPLRRCLHHAVYDEAGGRMWLYGGCSSGAGPCPQADLWSLDLASNVWTERTPQSSPPGREHYGFAFDAVRGRVVLFGGNARGSLNDTWEFDPRSGAWSESPVQGTRPRARSRHQAAYISDRGTMVFFGGLTDSGPNNELWMLGPGFLTPQIAGVANAFSGAANAVAPGELVSIFGSGLGPEEGIAFQFDPVTGRLPVSGPGVSVVWNGVPAPLYYASSGQLNVQVPYEIAGDGVARLIVTVNGAVSPPRTLAVVPAHPGLFQGAWNQDGSVNSADHPAQAGDVIVLYATGQGVTAPPSATGGYPRGGAMDPVLPVSLRIDDMEADVSFRGQAPGTAGVVQINSRIPDRVRSGTAPVTLKIGDAESVARVVVR